MNAIIIVLSVLLAASSSSWLEAQSSTPLSPETFLADAAPSYVFQFPQVLYDHPNYQTEWWCYTGNLHSERDKPYGFELTFFHSYQPTGAPAGQPQFIPIIFADLAGSDLDGQHGFSD